MPKRSRRLRTVLGLAAAGCLLAAGSAFAFVGNLDSTFSGDGRVTTSFGFDLDAANAVAVQSDGKIVAAGVFDFAGGFAVVRYHPNGTLDTDDDSDPGVHFDNDGMVTTDFGGAGGEAMDLVIQPDGKIVVVGYAYVDVNDAEDFAVARYNSDGSPDTAFGGGDGIAFNNFPDPTPTGGDPNQDTDIASGVGLDSSNRIVVAGRGDPSDSGLARDFAVARYGTNGVLDPSFDGDGLRTVNVLTSGSSGSADFGHDVVVQSNDKIVVIGQAILNQANFAFARFNVNGSLDTNSDADPGTDFSDNGIQNLDGGGSFPDSAFAGLQQPDGKIVFAGFGPDPQGGQVFAVGRLTTEGERDNSFSENGIQTSAFPGSFEDAWHDVGLQADGKILTVGYTQPNDTDFAAGRFNANGSVDRTWSPCDGAEPTDFGGGSDIANGLDIQADGKLVAAGASSADFALTRYQATGPVRDCDPPETTILGPKRTRKRRPVFRFVSDEAGSTFQCRIGGVGEKFRACTTPYRTRRLRRGFRSIEARAIDKAGNIDPTPAVKKFRILKKRKRR